MRRSHLKGRCTAPEYKAYLNVQQAHFQELSALQAQQVAEYLQVLKVAEASE